MDQRLLDDLLDWLRIPSISTGGGDPADLERAAAWVVQRVSAAGGEAHGIATEGSPAPGRTEWPPSAIPWRSASCAPRTRARPRSSSTAITTCSPPATSGPG